ncbi:DUF1444 family protein [Hyalangium gracile]|uniref:DUF1444 family protein n=1 Tax=Hyalangium gracile TaxID=394092 RepID=UPI001CCE8C54|nr:DUF1444 family protein [Hyalangium gracile]
MRSSQYGYLLLVIGAMATMIACQKNAKTDGSKLPERLAEKLSDPELEPGAFTNLCAEALKTLDPQATVSVVGPFQVAMNSQGVDLVAGFENPWRAAPAARAEAVWAQVLGVREASKAMAGQVVGELREIVPLVRGEVDAAVQLIKAGKSKQVAYPLTADLWVLYAFNKPTQFLPVMDEDLRRLDLDRAQVRATALENLRQFIPGFERKGGKGTWMLILPNTGGNFEASLLLLDEIWDDLEKETQGEVVAAVPARDLLFVTDSQNAAGVSKVSALAADAYAKGDHPVSKQVLVRRSGEWKPWAPP